MDSKEEEMAGKMGTKGKLDAIFYRRIWDILDIDEERSTIEMDNAIDVEAASPLFSSLLRHSQASFVIEEGYDGPHLPPKGPISPSLAKDVLDYLRKDGKKLPRVYARQIVQRVIPILKQRNTVQDVVLAAEGERIVVVGDLHGQLEDLHTILSHEGCPSQRTHFLFNGDFVDRGQKSVEVVLSLFILVVAFPNQMHLNRGNHEHWRINAKYGFQSEAAKKYSMEWFGLVQEAFRHLPLCHVINSSVMVVHGGLFKEEITLDRIRKINRTIDLPRTKHIKTEDESLMIQILWSDPRNIDSFFEPSHRGCGIHFGPKLTNQFLERSGLSLLVRSHEVVDEGMKKTHMGKVITLFSASHYTGSNTNYGGYLVFSQVTPDDDSVPSDSSIVAPPVLQSSSSSSSPSIPLVDFTSHTFVSGGALMAQKLKQAGGQVGTKTCEELMKKEAFELIYRKIFLQRHALMDWYSKADSDLNGSVTVEAWALGLRTILNLPQMPWDRLVSEIAVVKNGSVNYLQFLRRFRINTKPQFAERWLHKITTKISRLVVTKEMNIHDLFSQLDKNKDGKVTYQELVEILRGHGTGLTDPQLFDLMRALDTNGDGVIGEEEFLSAFKLPLERAVKERSEEFNPENEITRFREDVADRQVNLKTLFLSRCDDESIPLNEQTISKRATRKILDKIDLNDRLTKHQRKEVVAFIFPGKEKITYADVTEQLNPRYETPEWQDNLIQQVCGVLLSTQMHFQRLFGIFDTDGSGKIELDEFKSGLRFINEQMGAPLSDIQIENLHHTFDLDGDGSLIYDEFFDALRVIDTGPDS